MMLHVNMGEQEVKKMFDVVVSVNDDGMVFYDI